MVYTYTPGTAWAQHNGSIYIHQVQHGLSTMEVRLLPGFCKEHTRRSFTRRRDGYLPGYDDNTTRTAAISVPQQAGWWGMDFGGSSFPNSALSYACSPATAVGSSSARQDTRRRGIFFRQVYLWQGGWAGGVNDFVDEW